MKKVLLLSLICLFSISGMAQNDSIAEAYSRIQQLEEKIQQQNQTISKLSADVNEVLNQNLALKKNLNLKPTIAKAKIPGTVEFRIHDISGDPETGEIHAVITAHNIGESDKKLYYSKAEIIDELGHTYNNEERSRIELAGETSNLMKESVTHHVNAPYTLDFYISKYNPEAQYIKYLYFQVLDGTKLQDLVFENLPINWKKSN